MIRTPWINGIGAIIEDGRKANGVVQVAQSGLYLNFWPDSGTLELSDQDCNSGRKFDESIDFYIKAKYVEQDSLNHLALNLQEAYPGVISEFQFPTETDSKVSSYVKTAAVIFLFAAVLLTILVVFSIDNTIRLAMYSNRFLIKTMQMVGATRWFIAKPINQRAILNGLAASLIAIAAIWGSVLMIEKFIPDFKALHDTLGLLTLFLIIIILGVSITLVSTHRAVIKYLRMKLDDLY